MRKPLQIHAQSKSGKFLYITEGQWLISVHESAVVVEKLCEYLQYKTTYENVPPKEDIPDFSERIPPEIVLELFVASSFRYPEFTFHAPIDYSPLITLKVG